MPNLENTVQVAACRVGESYLETYRLDPDAIASPPTAAHLRAEGRQFKSGRPDSSPRADPQPIMSLERIVRRRAGRRIVALKFAPEIISGLTEIAEPGDYGFCGPKYHCAVGREPSSIDDLVLYSDFCRHNRREVGLRPASTIRGYEPPFPAPLLWKAGRPRIWKKNRLPENLAGSESPFDS